MIYQDPLAYLLGLEGIALLDTWAGDHDRAFTEARLAAVPQPLVSQQPPDLGQPGLSERAVVVSGPGIQQRDTLKAQQIPKRILIDHENRS